MHVIVIVIVIVKQILAGSGYVTCIYEYVYICMYKSMLICIFDVYILFDYAWNIEK